ncbi:hypothetical protein [Streptomyces sp. NPDC048442]|uniref:hypothetical protein n=1 Tax=Streptomyces sp. NPDC048442 TaxID=3154823 RepID=UPI003418C036
MPGRDAAQALSRLVEDVASGKAGYEELSDIARVFASGHDLAQQMPQALLKLSSLIGRVARDATRPPAEGSVG